MREEGDLLARGRKEGRRPNFSAEVIVSVANMGGR